MIHSYIVKYDVTAKRVIKVTEVEDPSMPASIWDNADVRMKGKGPLVGMAFWSPDLWFIFVQAESEDIAEKIAVDWIKWRNNE